ncbi:hypothetical protein GN958_ATG19038, partial [Phytophthora infestans]
VSLWSEGSRLLSANTRRYKWLPIKTRETTSMRIRSNSSRNYWLLGIVKHALLATEERIRECKTMFVNNIETQFIPTHLFTPEKSARYIVDIDNMSATRARNGKTQSEKLFGKVPDVGKIRVCGSVGFVHVAKQKP